MPGFAGATRGTTTQRGLGYTHQQLRARLLPTAYGKPCPHCGRIMHRGMKLELDHIVPRMLGGTTTPTNVRIVCAACNHAHGARLGNQLRHTRRTAPRTHGTHRVGGTPGPGW